MPDGTDYDPVRSYVMNAQVSGTGRGDISGASSHVMFADGCARRTLDDEDTTQIAQYCMTTETEYDTSLARSSVDGELDGTASGGGYPVESVGTYHDGGGNVVFVDGHVERIYWDDTVDACSGDW
jgi:prepilin-type processing-associated H-X9-DG protein